MKMGIDICRYSVQWGNTNDAGITYQEMSNEDGSGNSECCTFWD